MDLAETLNLLRLLLKEKVGSGVEIVDCKIGNQRHDYLVLLVQLRSPALELVVKLAGLEAPYDYPFERTAVIHRLVAAHTIISMPEIIAVDTSYREWPWRYLIKTHISGTEWDAVFPQLKAAQLSDTYCQIGNAVAQLHTIAFPAFGELSADGRVEGDRPYLDVLQRRANLIIKKERLRDYFSAVLVRYADLFADVSTANLCHEDLHRYNILFENRQGQWHLATILDFDKAWAGHRETDLARLDLWTGMTNESFWLAYNAVRPVDLLYKQRRPIYQLLWCLEAAWPTAKHLADTHQVCQELGLPVIESFDL
ncbi:MAG: phosphotransferase [Ardenticatenaceae bacterium]|nr:phosphotransferase [Ardenticatenaceae bacterium]